MRPSTPLYSTVYKGSTSAASLHIFSPEGFLPSASWSKMSRFLWSSGRISPICSTLVFRVSQQNWAPVIHYSSWLNKAHDPWLLSLPPSLLDHPHHPLPRPVCFLHLPNYSQIIVLNLFPRSTPQNTVGVPETLIHSSKLLSMSTFWKLLRLLCAP